METSPLPLKPGTLQRRLQHVIKVMRNQYSNFKDSHEMRLKQYVREFTVKLHAKFCLKTKQASPLTWPDARALARKLWNTVLPGSRTRANSVLLRKSAALALMIGTSTGARWADIHRLQWSDVKKVIKIFSKREKILFSTYCQKYQFSLPDLLCTITLLNLRNQV